MAGGAHGVPVHATSEPVAPLAGLAVFVTIDIKPLVGARIPGVLGGLQPAAGKGDQHLAQRIVGENPADGKRLIGAVQSRGNKLVVFVIGQDGGCLGADGKRPLRNEGSVVHGRYRAAFGKSVVRMVPIVIFLPVALPATGRAAVSWV